MLVCVAYQGARAAWISVENKWRAKDIAVETETN